MNSVLTACFIGFFASPSWALYDGSSSVVDLTPSNFDSKVKNSDVVWIVEFYAPWCGHCRNLAPEYQKAARALKGAVNVGAVDCDQHQQLCGQYGVQGFPTLKVFGSNKNKPSDYKGARTAAGIVDSTMKAVKDMVNDRMGGRSSGGGSGGSKGDVIELTDANFDKLVMKSDDMWLVEFFAPWCGHCKNLEPHWRKAANELKGKVKLGAVDATVHQMLSQRYGIQGFPTIKYFPAGPKSQAENYDGGRTADDIVVWANERYDVNLPPPEVNQLVSQKALDENCVGKQLCVIAFLPHILDSGAAGRNTYIDIMTKVGEKYKKNNWGWLWSEAMAQDKLEESLGVGGFGYPALTAISIKKGKAAMMRGSFSRDGVHEFLRDTLYGKASTGAIKGGQLPDLRNVEPWDGKDGELPTEEDIDLNDVDLDDKEEL